MALPPDFDKWFDDWKPGDTALCMASDWQEVATGKTPHQFPIKGEIYTVAEVRIKVGFGFRMAGLAFEGMGKSYFWNKHFKKLEPINEQILESAKRGARVENTPELA